MQEWKTEVDNALDITVKHRQNIRYKFKLKYKFNSSHFISKRYFGYNGS